MHDVLRFFLRRLAWLHKASLFYLKILNKFVEVNQIRPPVLTLTTGLKQLQQGFAVHVL
jgi:hypothetical protein